MLLLIHKKEKKVVRVLRDGQPVPFNEDPCKTLWKLASDYPQELLIWAEEEHLELLNRDKLSEIFSHKRIMASYAIKTTFLPESIGYVDQLPFINVNRKVRFPTWQMSCDLGGINTGVLSCFEHLKSIKDLGFLLNSVAKVGQQNGLFCYSDPCLSIKESAIGPGATASKKQLFQFIFQHYKTVRTFFLLWCFFIYEKELPFLPFFSVLGVPKFFRKKVNIPDIILGEDKKSELVEKLDVIIPTIGRKKYLLKVLEDLSRQLLLPEKVIIVEQNPDKNSISELSKDLSKKWPFEIVHHFTHQTGACKARNLALKEVSSEWVFLSDDDQRFGPELLKLVFEKIKLYGVNSIVTTYLQPGEKKVFEVTKQWGSFGAGNSIVKREFLQNVSFSNEFEHGYNEDTDFGMQLRNKGCDVIYHPDLDIKHLKAPVGGFREKVAKEWEFEYPVPKPSPTVMVYSKKYYTLQQMNGYKMELFLRYYNKQPIKNPWKYIQEMRVRWNKSEQWADRLMGQYKKKEIKI